MALTRRDYLSGSLALGVHGPVRPKLSRADVTDTSKGKRPNVLWIQTDEHRPDSLGCYGSKWARTPNVDRLAAEGTTFHECHVQSPVCVPSRTSMLTGRYPQELGVFDNSKAYQDGVLNPAMKTFPNLFADAGYRTASLGKWHTPNHPTWQQNVHFETYPQLHFINAPPGAEEAHHVIRRLGGKPIILGGVYPYHDWGITASSHLTDMAIDWLKDAAKSGQPFLLRVSHLWPHYPILPPQPWDALYSTGEVPCHAGNRQAYDTRSRYDRAYADTQRGLDFPMSTWRQICAYYYGLCAYVDHEIGRLMQALEGLKLRENTIVALNSDHGQNLGEAGLCEKSTYDREVWRVPFVISWPGHVPGDQHRHDLMELIDFGPTICALAGILLDPGMRGRDLFHSKEPEAVFAVIGTGRRAAARTRKYRFDCSLGSGERKHNFEDCDPNLFDLEADPWEERNLIHDPSTRNLAREMFDRIQRWMANPVSAYPA
jgi:choline-sulfatase